MQYNNKIVILIYRFSNAAHCRRHGGQQNEMLLQQHWRFCAYFVAKLMTVRRQRQLITHAIIYIHTYMLKTAIYMRVSLLFC